jgi:hypothetical protein
MAGFAATVHLADPGHASAMTPVVCLFGGRLIDRAVDQLTHRVSRFEIIAMSGLVIGHAQIFFGGSHLAQVLLAPVLCAVAGVLLRYKRHPLLVPFPTWQSAGVLILPSLCLNGALFIQPGWEFDVSPDTRGLRGAAERLWSGFNREVYALNLGLVRQVTGTDDRVVGQVGEWAAERPGRTMVVSVEAETHWRKLAYYLPALPVFVVKHKTPDTSSPRVLILGQGAEARVVYEGPAPVPLPARGGARLIWALNRRDNLRAELIRLGAVCSGLVCRQDLPEEPGSQRVGDVAVVR